MRCPRFWPVVIATAVLLAGCAPRTAPAPQTGSPSGTDGPAQPKRLIVGSRETASLLNGQLDSNADVVEELTSAGLVRFTPTGEATALLAEGIPTLENNQLVLFPDGRMETTWRLREGLKWQDGMPLTTDDLLFAVRLGQDLPEFGHAAYRSLNGVRAIDARTITVEWKEPYIQYDNMFSWEFALPLPRHLLEDTYLNNKEAFTQHLYWTHQFMHTGPFKVREFVPTERLLLDAWPDFVFGRPRVDEVEVQFVPDANTLIANVFAGGVQATIGTGISVDQALQVTEGWRDGKAAHYPYQYTTVAKPQFINPDPRAILDVRFRRALLHAIDREALNETVTRGLAPTSGFNTPPGAPEFAAITPSVVQYPYDPRRAAQLIEEAGFVRVGDTYRDPNGTELAVRVEGNKSDTVVEKTVLFVADSWQRVGVKTTPDLYEPRARNQEARATRPGFEVGAHAIALAAPRWLTWWHSSNVPTAENRWRGNNYNRYANDELDGLIDRFHRSIPYQERVEAMKQIAHHVTDHLVELALVHHMQAALVNNRILNFTPRTAYAQTWDAHLWDIQ